MNRTAAHAKHPSAATPLARRTLLARALACVLTGPGLAHAASFVADHRWYAAAEAERQRALFWGDQPYGAVVVLGERLVGEGPSRVVLRRDATAHAEREAIRDAQRRLGRTDLAGAVLYSTSRPCADCEAAAAAANVARMIHGPDLTDAGAPQRRGGRVGD